MKESIQQLATRVSKDELEHFYREHGFSETARHFNTKNLRKLLIFYSIDRNTTKKHFDDLKNSISKNELQEKINSLPFHKVYEFYNISNTTLYKLVDYFHI